MGWLITAPGLCHTQGLQLQKLKPSGRGAVLGLSPLQPEGAPGSLSPPRALLELQLLPAGWEMLVPMAPKAQSFPKLHCQLCVPKAELLLWQSQTFDFYRENPLCSSRISLQE